MKTVKYIEVTTCRGKYDRCPETTCPCNSINVGKQSFFAIDEWPISNCPELVDTLREHSFNDEAIEWFKSECIEGEKFSIPDEVCEYFKREATKMFNPRSTD